MYTSFTPRTRASMQVSRYGQCADMQVASAMAARDSLALIEDAANCCSDGCPASIAASRQVLSLPMSADLTEADQDRVVAGLRDALGA